MVDNWIPSKNRFGGQEYPVRNNTMEDRDPVKNKWEDTGISSNAAEGTRFGDTWRSWKASSIPKMWAGFPVKNSLRHVDF